MSFLHSANVRKRRLMTRSFRKLSIAQLSALQPRIAHAIPPSFVYDNNGLDLVVSPPRKLNSFIRIARLLKVTRSIV